VDLGSIGSHCFHFTIWMSNVFSAEPKAARFQLAGELLQGLSDQTSHQWYRIVTFASDARAAKQPTNGHAPIESGEDRADMVRHTLEA
jgi:hypothetical protein